MYKNRVKHYLKDEQIYNFYIDYFCINKKLYSPLRYDPGPSFYTKYTKEGFLIWIDFGLDQDNYDAIGFVSCLFKVDREGAAKKIFEDIINKGIFPDFPPENISRELPAVILKKSLSDFELVFWNEYLISRPTLEFFNVYSLDGLYIKDELIWKSSEELPRYVYTFPEQSFKAKKIYSPGGKKSEKFRGYSNASILEGYEQLPEKGDLLIITKSLKDVMVLYEAGYNAVSPPSENNIKVIRDYAEELQSRFNKIIIIFDNDETGETFSDKLKEEFGFPTTFMSNDKDASDYSKRTKSFNDIHKAIDEVK